jgi:vancomycin resistance protein VanW
MYNYLDYRFKNNTPHTFQLLLSADGEYLRGELLSDSPLEYAYHIREEDAHFVNTPDGWRRRNKVYRIVIDKRTGNTIEKTLVCASDAEVLYAYEESRKQRV